MRARRGIDNCGAPEGGCPRNVRTSEVGVTRTARYLSHSPLLCVLLLGCGSSSEKTREFGYASDAGYTSGEIGLYVETFDSPRAHIHFDELTIREVDAPQWTCNVVVSSVNMRRGPSTAFIPVQILIRGDIFEALGRSSDGQWIRAQAIDGNKQGWVYYYPEFITCNVPATELPVVQP